MFSVQGIGDVVVSAVTYSYVDAGVPMRYWLNNEVTQAVEGQIFHGIAVNSKKGMVTSVQLGGFVTVPYTGDDPNVGYERFLATSDGSIKLDTTENINNPLRLVVEVDKDQKKVTFML